MEAYRVRTINTDGSISVLDKTFSQTCEMLNGLSQEERNKFWDKTSINLPTGENVKFVKEV